jgi:hypothetical protein
MGGTNVRIALRRRGWLIAVVVSGVLLVSTACGGAPIAQSDAVVAAAESSATPKPTASRTPTATPTPTPVVTVEEERVVEAVPFESSRVDDASLPSGTTAIGTAGVGGERTTIFRVTYTDGIETAREQVSAALTRPPVNEVIRVGTFVAPPPPPPPAPEPVAPASGGCDPNYTGACVPISSDVDCEGGSGNGPAYVRGPVTVIGSDPYGLDHDGDGVGCES